MLPGPVVTPQASRGHPISYPHPVSALGSRSPFLASPTSLTARPVRRQPRRTSRRPAPHHPASSPCEDAAVPWTLRAIFVPIPPVRIRGGRAVATSEPTAIQVAVPGVSCIVSSVTATFRRPCAVKAHGRNVVRPWGMQVPHEPLELSIAGHLAL